MSEFTTCPVCGSPMDENWEATDSQMSNWQPIDTAPKDGWIDLWVDGGRVTDCHWGVVDHPPHWWTQELKLQKTWLVYHHEWGEWIEVGAQPTHWMPLPEPPQAVIATT